MNIAQLSDAQTVESGRKIGDGNFDFAHVETKSLRHKTVRRAHKRHRARNHSRGLKKVTPGMIDVFRMRAAYRECGRCSEPTGLSEDDVRKRLHSHSAPAMILMNR